MVKVGEAAKYLNMSVSHLRHLGRGNGLYPGPPYTLIRVGTRSDRLYKPEDLDKWLAERAKPTNPLKVQAAADYVGFSKSYLTSLACGNHEDPGPKFTLKARGPFMDKVYTTADLDEWKRNRTGGRK